MDLDDSACQWELPLLLMSQWLVRRFQSRDSLDFTFFFLKNILFYFYCVCGFYVCVYVFFTHRGQKMSDSPSQAVARPPR